MKNFRMKATFTAVRFDPLDKPDDVEPRMFGKQKSLVVWYWTREEPFGQSSVHPGDWMVTDNYGNRSVVDDETFRMLYEEIPDVGEGGGSIH